MFLDCSAQRILVSGSNSVILNSRFDFIPASLTVLVNTVPSAVGPAGDLSIRCTRGLNLGSFVPSARNANTSTTGRSISTVASNSPAIGLSLVQFAGIILPLSGATHILRRALSGHQEPSHQVVPTGVA